MTKLAVVSIVSGRRDSYNLSKAFWNDPRFDIILVTDFWSFLGIGKHRHASGIARRSVKTQPIALLLLQVFRRFAPFVGPLEPLQVAAHFLLERRSKRSLKRADIVVCYSTARTEWLRKVAPQAHIAVFYHHPPPSMVRSCVPASGGFADADPSSRINARQEQAWIYSDTVACASSFSRRGLLASGCPEERIAVIPYGTDEGNAAEPSRNQTLPRTRRASLLFVGHDPVRKGLPELLDALKGIDTSRWELRLVCSDLRSVDVAWAGPAIKTETVVSSDRLSELYDEADLLLLPSHAEGWGLVLAEAMHHGCWVAASRNTCIPDLDPGGECSFPLEPDETIGDSLDRAIRSVEAGLDRSIAHDVAQRATWAGFRRKLSDLVEARAEV